MPDAQETVAWPGVRPAKSVAVAVADAAPPLPLEVVVVMYVLVAFENVPRLVVNVTVVPFGTASPTPSVSTAVMVVKLVPSAFMDVDPAESEMLATTPGVPLTNFMDT